jgi:hypothetical protein
MPPMNHNAEKRTALIEKLRLAHEEQDRASKPWLAMYDEDSAEYESAWVAYSEANAKVNQIISALNAPLAHS